MIMRFSGIALISAAVGACAALAPIPHAAEPHPAMGQKIQWHTPKVLNPRPGKLDPEINSRLDSIEGEVRALDDQIRDRQGAGRATTQLGR